MDGPAGPLPCRELTEWAPAIPRHRELAATSIEGNIATRERRAIAKPPLPPLTSRPTPPPFPAMLSGILIFNQKGENLIFRAFRNDCRPRLADVFRIQVISNAQVRSPILTLGSTTFSHVKHENIYLVAVTKSNANAALVFEFLYRLVGLGKAYFTKFDEEAVKNNFVLVYELLDEILDFGYPQNTETDTLKMYITTEGVKSERALVIVSVAPRQVGRLTLRRKTRPKSLCKPLVHYLGGERTSDIARTRLLWMLSRTSICSCLQQAPYFEQMSTDRLSCAHTYQEHQSVNSD